MIDTELPAPTVTSNASAANLACDTERKRVLAILALAEPPIAADVVDAIAMGTPAQQVRRRVTGAASPAAGSGSAAGGAVPRAPAPSAPAHPWASITSRYPPKRKRTRAATP